MNKFEASWRSGYEFFERFNTEDGSSNHSRIDLPYEWYTEASNGLYEYILDPSIKLSKQQSNNSKNGREEYGFLDPIYRNIRDNYWNNDGYNMNPRTWYLDIETRVGTASTGFPVPEKALEPISLIQIYDSSMETMIILGYKDWVYQDQYKFDYKIKYVKCDDEISLLKSFISIFNKLDPLIIYAWNGMGFDFPYIQNRLKKLGFDKNALSNYGNVSLKQSEFKGRTTFDLKSDGHFFMDLMDVYKKYTYAPRASFSLDNIANVELGVRKVQHTEYVSFDDFYTGNYTIPMNPTEEQLNSEIYKAAIVGNKEKVKELAHSEFVYYGVIDTFLIKQIDDKLNFTKLLLMIAEKMGVQIGDALGTVKPWSQYLSNKAMLSKQVMPPRADHDSPHVVGGFVKDPNKGKHKWVLSCDVNSMYPLLGMVGFNMSPETFIKKHELPADLRDVVLKYYGDQDEANRLEQSAEIKDYTKSLLENHNMSLGINGAVFSKEKRGMIPELVQDIYKSRKTAKKTMFLYERQKLKIKDIINKKEAA